MDYFNNDKHDAFWNWVFSLTPTEGEESIKDIFQSAFPFAKHLLDDLYWVSANVIYANLVCGASQLSVGKILDMSQYGISKKVKSGIEKLRLVVIRPESDREILREDLYKMLPPNEVETLLIYYNTKTFSMTTKIIGNITEGAVRVRIMNSITKLTAVSLAPSIDELLSVIEKNGVHDFQKIKESIFIDEHNAEIIQNMASRYIKYLEIVLSMNNYSDFMWKKMDGNR